MKKVQNRERSPLFRELNSLVVGIVMYGATLQVHLFNSLSRPLSGSGQLGRNFGLARKRLPLQAQHAASTLVCTK